MLVGQPSLQEVSLSLELQRRAPQLLQLLLYGQQHLLHTGLLPGGGGGEGGGGGGKGEVAGVILVWVCLLSRVGVSYQ